MVAEALEVFGDDLAGDGEVVAGLEERRDRDAGPPHAVGLHRGESGLLGEHLDEEEVGDRAGHRDDELAEAVAAVAVVMGGDEAQVGEDVAGLARRPARSGREWDAGCAVRASRSSRRWSSGQSAKFAASADAGVGEELGGGLVVGGRVVADVERGRGGSRRCPRGAGAAGSTRGRPARPRIRSACRGRA